MRRPPSSSGRLGPSDPGLDGQPAVFHRAEALGAAGDGAVVSDHHHRQALVLPQLLKQADELVAGVLVEVAGRLVGEEDLGLLD
jgi:hypothetical protein